ncbi:hypothetical protein ACHAW5_005642 [Stephanodiscus triporus]|uniref:Helicase-associated domain-containing protein n=1 Tax=Stephanodiscus triporus TaxID=2934178 RepID=A0ABD3MTV6_9STRA
MTLLLRSFRPLTGALQSFLKPFEAKCARDFYIVRNRPTESSISSILPIAPYATGHDDAHNPRGFPSLVGVDEIRCLTSSAADDIVKISSCSDDDWDDEAVEATRRKAWLERLNELRDYKLNHGDTLVPQRYPANPLLGRWVTKQRSDYMNYQSKKEFDEKWSGVEVLDDEVTEEMYRLMRRSSGMNEKRIQLLEAEGFVWDPLEAQWFERLNELKDYKMNHGDTLVPRQKKMDFEEKWRGVGCWMTR